MSGKKSRDKGYRGEREVVKILGSEFQRTGYAGISNPDVSSSWAIISVKNHSRPISMHESQKEIINLEAQEPNKNHYVAVKVNHKWLIIQRIEQFKEDRCH